MSTIQQIEQAVSQLSSKELARFREWFDEFDAEEWDRQFESDAESGRLDRLAGQALDDWRAGKAKDWRRPSDSSGAGCVPSALH